jgi:hypothetical protein
MIGCPRSSALTGGVRTKPQFDRSDIELNKLVVTTLESRFRLYDMRTHHPTFGTRAWCG